MISSNLLMIKIFDRKSQFQSLLVVQTRIDLGAVGFAQIGLLQGPGATQTLGDVLTGEFQVYATQARTMGFVDLESQFDFFADVVKTAGFVTIGSGFGVAMQWSGTPAPNPVGFFRGGKQSR